MNKIKDSKFTTDYKPKILKYLTFNFMEIKILNETKTVNPNAANSKFRNLLLTLITFFIGGAVSPAFAQDGEFSISGDCYNSILGGVAFDGQNYLAGMTGDLKGDSNVTVQFISSGGQLSGNRIALGETGSAPVIAFDGTNYLVIWADRYVGFLDDGEDAGMTNIYGRFITPSGEFAGNKFTIVSNAYIKGSTPGAIHFNGSNYFFVYKEDDGNNDEGHEYGRFISTQGKVSENPVQITTTDVQDIALAFDGTNYLTVFNADSKYIYGQFVSLTGTLVGARFLIDNSENYSDDPVSVAFSGGKYLVAFPDDNKPGMNENPEWNIFGRFVSTSGEVYTDKITICDYTQNPIFPTTAFDGTNYLTAWISMVEQKIKGKFLNSSGEPVDNDYVIFGSTSGTMPLGGVSLFSGNKYLAVCTRVNWQSGTKSNKEQNIELKSVLENTNNGIYGRFLDNKSTRITRNIDGNNLLKIYPNPATDLITLNISEVENSVLNIYKITGDLVGSKKINATNQQIYVGNLSAGIYMVEIKSAKWSEKQKLIINR